MIEQTPFNETVVGPVDFYVDHARHAYSRVGLIVSVVAVETVVSCLIFVLFRQRVRPMSGCW